MLERIEKELINENNFDNCSIIIEPGKKIDNSFFENLQ